MSLLYATKIWTWTETSTAEPYIGTSVLGREMYWTLAFKDFENLAKVGNKSLGCFEKCTTSISQPEHKMTKSGLYYKCFTIIIYNRNDIGLYYMFDEQ